MLIDSFFKILEINPSMDDHEKVEVKIELNEKHEIFEGHFPGNPVVPGVCLIQIVKEVVSAIVKKELDLVSAKDIKFIAVVNPEINKILHLNLKIKHSEDGMLQVNNVTFYEDKIFFKFLGNLKPKDT